MATNPFKTKSLNSQIAAAADKLRADQDAQAQQSAVLAEQSALAARNSTESARKAAAAEEALRILDDAEVVL